jgi:UDP-glucuronate 4-epimerase
MIDKRILITGCAGFIGFHFARFLKEAGIYVVGLDNFNDYYDPKLKEARARHLEKLGCTIVREDIGNEQKVVELLKQHAITHLVHLAAQAGCRYSLINPESYLKINIEGFFHILEACKKVTGTRLVYASSSSVYGKNKKIPFTVGDPTDQPANIYGMTKKSKELMAYTYQSLFGMGSVGLRFFTAYGPWGKPDMAYYSFTQAIRDGKPIDLYNFGNMRRDFTYIDDIVQGISAALEIENGYHIFNLGSNHPEPLEKLVELIEQELGKKAIKNLLPMPATEILETYADIEESKRVLGFDPKIPLHVGIPRFVKWFKEYHK